VRIADPCKLVNLFDRCTSAQIETKRSTRHTFAGKAAVPWLKSDIWSAVAVFFDGKCDFCANGHTASAGSFVAIVSLRHLAGDYPGLRTLWQTPVASPGLAGWPFFGVLGGR
jgi:hypothetical protein